jgi:uncharacterized protein YgbK (DUF1537 family)
MIQNAVKYFPRQIQTSSVLLQNRYNTDALLIVAKSKRTDTVERPLTGMTERRMPEIVPEADRFGQVFVEKKRSRNGTGDLRNFERVRKTGTEVIVGRTKENLRFMFQTAESAAMNDPIAIALILGANGTGLDLFQPAFRFFTFLGVFAQKVAFIQ